MNRKMQISFTGEFNYTIDTKGRLNIPAKFRKALDPINDRTFVLTRGFDNCLLLYPVDEWQKVEEQLSILSSIRNRHRNFVRSVVRYATYVQFDSQGRVQIPESLLKHANIQKDVSIIGMIKKIEIWAPTELSDYESKNILRDEENFEDLANDINF